MVGSIGNFWVVVRLLVVEHVLNTFLFSIRVSMRFSAEVEVTCILFRMRLLQFSNLITFWNVISWKYFSKENSIRSSLIECQPFPHSKIDVDPTYCVLMSFPCIVQVLCMTWYIQFDHLGIFMTSLHRINKQEKYCCLLLEF